MRSGLLWLAIVGICILLLVPGVSALDLLQPKSKAVGMSWEDFRSSANNQRDAGNTLADLEGAVASYTTAEDKLKAQYDGSGKPYDAAYYSAMHGMEVDKLFLFQKMKEMERKRAYDASYDAKGNPISGPQEALDAMQATDNAEKYERAEKQADANANNLNSKYQTEYEREHHGGCLIVTAAFGSPLAGEVQLVRDYRDGTIRQSYTGSQFFLGFNAWYYSFSPAVADFVATHPLVKSVMQVCLVPLLTIVLLSQNLHTVLGFSPDLATVCVLLFGASFYSLVYILPPAFLMAWLARRRGWNVPAPGRMKPVLAAWILLITGLTAGVLLSLDFLVMVASGLLVACTIILVAGTGSTALTQYLGKRAVL